MLRLWNDSSGTANSKRETNTAAVKMPMPSKNPDTEDVKQGAFHYAKAWGGQQIKTQLLRKRNT